MTNADSSRSTIEEPDLGTDGRVATIHGRPDGTPKVASVVVTADQLESMGIDPYQADSVRFSVEDGEPHFEAA